MMEEFPLDGLPDMARDFLEVFRESTESPDEFLAAGALFAGSVIAGKWVTFNGQMLNDYYLLVGPTGTVKKTTAQSLAVKVLRVTTESRRSLVFDDGETDQKVQGPREAYPIATHFSVEGLQEHSIGNGTSTAVVLGEYAALFDVGKRPGQKNTITEITNLYDGNPIVVRTLSRQVDSANYAVSVFGASTEAWLAEFLSEKNVSGGFVNRHLVFQGKPERLIPTPAVINEAMFGRLADKLVQLIPPNLLGTRDGKRVAWTTNPITLRWDPDAEMVWNHFYCDRVRLMRGLRDAALVEVAARELTHATKLSGLRCFMSGRRTVRLDDLNFGVRLSRWATRNSIDLIGKSTTAGLTVYESAILGRIRRHDSLSKKELALEIGGVQAPVNRALDVLFARRLIEKSADGRIQTCSGPNSQPEQVVKSFGKTDLYGYAERLGLRRGDASVQCLAKGGAND